MLRPRGFAAQLVLPLAFVLLAGCSGGPGAESKAVAPVPEFAPDAEVDAEHGAIRGLVLDAEQNPIPLTQLLLRPTDQTAVSAADGGFVFSMLEPGVYNIYASRIGYSATEIKSQVKAEETTQTEVPLVAVVVTKPWKDVIGPFDGYFQCRWASTVTGSGPCGSAAGTGAVTGALWTNDNVAMTWKLKGADWNEIVFEAKWTPSSAATNSKMAQIFSYEGRAPSHLWMQSEPQASPLWANYTPTGPHPGSNGSPSKPNETLTMRNWLAVGTSIKTTDLQTAAVAYEMRFQAMVTVFYSSTAPKDYTALPS